MLHIHQTLMKYSFFISFQNDRSRHQEKSIMKYLACPRMDCQASFYYCDVRRHFKTHEHVIVIGPHFSQFVRLNDAFFTEWKKLKILPVELELDGDLLIFLSYRDHEKKEWHFYCTVIASKGKLTKYKFVICISSQNGVSKGVISPCGRKISHLANEIFGTLSSKC